MPPEMLRRTFSIDSFQSGRIAASLVLVLSINMRPLQPGPSNVAPRCCSAQAIASLIISFIHSLFTPVRSLIPRVELPFMNISISGKQRIIKYTKIEHISQNAAYIFIYNFFSSKFWKILSGFIF